LPQNHDDPIAGHFAAKQTIELVTRKYYRLGIARDIAQYTDTCVVCAQSKSCKQKSYGKPQSLLTPTKPWANISLDFIVGLPRSGRTPESKEKNAILIVVDSYTKMARYFAVTDKTDIPSLAEVLALKLVLKGVGFPESIVLNRGQVTSKFWSAFCFYLRIRCQMSSVYHPQRDGQTERQNRTIEQYLRSYINYHQEHWVKWLPLAEFVYNNSFHASTGVTPFFALMGHHHQMKDTLRELSEDSRVSDVPIAKERAV
jgi:hypothetical protein